VHALFLEGRDLAAVAAIDDVDLRVASTSFMNRTQRVQRMQRFRLSMSVGPKSTSAFTPSPSNTRRGTPCRLSLGPNE
jgi:hypothetical protein